MTPPAAAPSPVTDPRRLDEAVARLRDGAPIWARASLPERIALARSMARGVERTAERAVAAACAAKGIAPGSPVGGEEWLSGPYVVLRQLRLVIRSLEALARRGNTPIGATGETLDGRLTARVFPVSATDRALFMGVSADVHLEEGVGRTELDESRARFYKAPDHDGEVCLVLGAGNINAIPPADVVTKLFNEGKVCVLKMNPVNAYLGPLFEEAFAEAIARGFLAVVYGGAEEGWHLAHHPGVDEVHITGSDRTHDLIVWGPPGSERAARMARNDPLLRKEITSELGNITPVLVVPGAWDARTLAAQAESVAGMLTHNASYNCIAGKMLVTARGWRQRDEFLAAVERFTALAPPRRAWYPGSASSYHRMLDGRARVRRIGDAAEGELPWAIVPGVAPDPEDVAFRQEPFCAVLWETEIGSPDPVEFLDAAVTLANETLWGTLAAHIVAHPRTISDRTTGAALEGAIRRLRYGSVSVNCWAGYGFAFGTTPWGAYPGAPLTDIQSGRGFVHNALMLEHVEKTVIRHPAVAFPKPPYFPSHRTAHVLGRGLTRLEARGLTALPRVLAAGVRG
ncbi:aldehyde dehydrogenase family protein [Anaeromyxobacter terrae]|uniref:aldehyde dehydrogenase family protein n=1 Tax=Anaeromyxobacter terrae TaxID=2925406 RepID=UPI001F56E14E|nr:aldehyde dehydrogenase family protein [Anaeromyxobacter sp. SG22]